MNLDHIRRFLGTMNLNLTFFCFLKSKLSGTAVQFFEILMRFAGKQRV